MSLMRDYSHDFRGEQQAYDPEIAKDVYLRSCRDATDRGITIPSRLPVNAEEASNARDVARLLSRRVFGGWRARKEA